MAFPDCGAATVNIAVVPDARRGLQFGRDAFWPAIQEDVVDGVVGRRKFIFAPIQGLEGESIMTDQTGKQNDGVPTKPKEDQVLGDDNLEDEEKILAGRHDVNYPALLTKDVPGG